MTRAYKVDSAPEGAREGDIPYYARWEDGSEYKCEAAGDNGAIRSYHGPVFGRKLGDWTYEAFSWAIDHAPRP